MRVAAIYDIHGNLPALEAALEEIRAAGVDQIVVGGDIFPGPMASECLDLILSLQIPTLCIKGNGDRAVLDLLAGREPVGVGGRFRHVFDWHLERVSRSQAEAMEAWPLTLELHIPGLGRVLFCHATPHNDMDVFTERTPEEKLRRVLTGFDAQVVVCGHTHMQFDRIVGDWRIVNAGSVGSPHGDPGAYCLLLGEQVELKRTSYDFAAAAARVRVSGYPLAEEFADAILKPAPKAQMLELYTGWELS